MGKLGVYRLCSMVTAQLLGFLVGLLSLFSPTKLFKNNALVVIRPDIIGIEANGLLVSDERLLIALEILKRMPFVIVGQGRVGIEANGVVKGSDGLVIALKA